MTDHTDHLEEVEQGLEIPADTTARYRLIKRLIAQRFYWAMAFLYSLFLNIILIWEFRL